MSFKKVFICIGIVLLLCSCLPPDSQKEENPSGGLDVPEGVLLLEEDRTYTLPENAMYALFLCLPQEDQNYGFDGSNETEFSSSDFAKVSLHFTSPRIKGAECIRDRHSDSLPLLTPKIPGTYENMIRFTPNNGADFFDMTVSENNSMHDQWHEYYYSGN